MADFEKTKSLRIANPEARGHKKSPESIDKRKMRKSSLAQMAKPEAVSQFSLKSGIIAANREYFGIIANGRCKAAWLSHLVL